MSKSKILLSLFLTSLLSAWPLAHAAKTTPIHAIQGSASQSRLTGQECTIEGVVVGDFQKKDQLRGFFVQEKDADADERTSEGIFVYDSRARVRMGDWVRVTGKIAEYHGLTEIKSVRNVKVIKNGVPLPPPATVRLPFQNANYPERFEGMRVVLAQTLTVSDTFGLGRYGQVTLSEGRLMAPTQVALPGKDARAVSAANALNQIILDDGSEVQNPDLKSSPLLRFSKKKTLRSGYTVRGLTGVLTYAFGKYRIHPTEPPQFDAKANPRGNSPDVKGRLRVASFNVLRYFNGPDFPIPGGAKNPKAFRRQRAKIINAITAMNADIIGLMELENDGYGPDSAIHDLVKGLNQAASSGTSYAFVNLDLRQAQVPNTRRLGDQDITLGLLYNKKAVALVGNPATKRDGAFAGKNRQPLAGTFRETRTGEQVTVVVCHFKSKTSRSPCPNDPDQGDGQGTCNKTRTKASADLMKWLASDPTGVRDPDILIIGDLNAYLMEDPVLAFEKKGYANLIKAKAGQQAYSYVHGGEAGCLDHALASPSLAKQVTGIAYWHINADEPYVFSYNGDADFYADSPYRSSDHDPVLIGLDLGK